VRLIRAADAPAAAAMAAGEIATACRDAVAGRGVALVALSGGATPWLMLERLRDLDLPWAQLYVAQVDERIAPAGDSRRNLTGIERLLVDEGPLPRTNLLAMPVESADRSAAARDYQRLLESRGATPLQLDLVHLGLGTDGHTASLVPGDPALDVQDRDVAVTGEYQGLPRMTLTFPALARARRRLWLVTGESKRGPLADLLAGATEGCAPALRVAREAALVIADAAACDGLAAG
jgi:6-phosphogluconolactonase